MNPIGIKDNKNFNIGEGYDNTFNSWIDKKGLV